MQVLTLHLAALALLGAANAPAPPPATGPQAVIREIQSFIPPGRQCRDGASSANAEPSGQPRFEREPAAPNEGKIIYAVDRQVDGCSVVVVKYDKADILGLQRRYERLTQQAPQQKGK